jgi:hypothetical protein
MLEYQKDAVRNSEGLTGTPNPDYALPTSAISISEFFYLN